MPSWPSYSQSGANASMPFTLTAKAVVFFFAVSSYASMVGGLANRFVVSRSKAELPFPLSQPQMVLSTLSMIGSTSPAR